VIKDLEVGILRQEAEVGDGVHFGSRVVELVELSLREDVVDLKATELSEQRGSQR